MTEQIELKPCPFCGKSVATVGTVAEVQGDIGNEWSETHYVAVCDFNNGGCGSCGTCDNETPEQAIEAWNRRCSCDD